MKIPLTPIRFLRYAREQFANKVGVICGNQRFTYKQFAERSTRLAGVLVEAGARPGDRIAFLSTNCHRLLEAYYGVLEAGCILLPLNVRLGSEELAFVLDDAQARFLFIEPAFLPLVESFRALVPSVEFFFLLDGEPRVNWLKPLNYDDLLAETSPYESDFTEVDEDSVAELFYTSGSSDRPKGVMLTHRNVYLHALSVIAAGQTSPITLEDMSCRSVLLHTHSTFSCQWLGHGAHHHGCRRHARHASPLQSGRGFPPNRAGTGYYLCHGSHDGHGIASFPGAAEVRPEQFAVDHHWRCCVLADAGEGC